MRVAASSERMSLEQDQRISEAVKREQSRLRNFIRRRVPDPRDAEDILQDVFYKLVEANRLLMPIEHVTGWLFRVARNRITDLFRKKKLENFSDVAVEDLDDGLLQLEDLLPSPDAGPGLVRAGTCCWMKSGWRLTSCQTNPTQGVCRARAGRGAVLQRWPPRRA